MSSTDRRTFLALCAGSLLWPGVAKPEWQTYCYTMLSVDDDMFPTRMGEGDYKYATLWVCDPTRKALVEKKTKQMFGDWERAIWFGSHDL